MAVEREDVRIADITERSIPEIIDFVLANGQKPPRHHTGAIAQLDLDFNSIAPPPIGELLKIPGYYHRLPKYFEIRENGSEITLTIGYKISKAIDITWDHDYNKVTAIEKDWREEEGQNWIQFDYQVSSALLKEDPWMARIDSELLSKINGIIINPPRGNLVLVSHKTDHNRVLQFIYHLDIHGQRRGYTWLTSREIKEPGVVVETKFATSMPSHRASPNEEIAGYLFKTRISIDDMTRNALFPELSYGKNFSHYKNFWQIKRL